MNKPEWNAMNVRLYSVLFSYHNYLVFGQIYRFIELILSVIIKKHEFRCFTLTASDFSSYSMYHQKTLDLKIH